MKLRLGDIKEIIRLHFKEWFCTMQLSYKFNVASPLIYTIILGYKSNGDNYLIHPAKNNSYSQEIKVELSSPLTSDEYFEFEELKKK